MTRHSEQSWAGRGALVTGATGMIGSWLTRRLVDSGARVVVLIRDADPQSELLRSGTIEQTSVVSGCLEDAATVNRAVVDNEVDTVFHLGAQTIVGAAKRDPIATFQSNIAGSWNVLEAARLHPDLIKSVLVASSDKAYGTAPTLPYTEDMPLSGENPYDVSKSCTDLLSSTYAKTYGVPLAIARCGNIYGGGDLNWSRIVPGTIRSLAEGTQPILRSDGTFVRDYLHVDDVVDAYLALAAAVADGREHGEGFNFSDESPMTVRQIYDATCLAAVGELVEPKILGKATGEIHDQYLDSTKARDRLGWKIGVGLEEGLRRTVHWYHSLLGKSAG